MEYYIKIMPSGRVKIDSFGAEQNMLEWLQKQVGGLIETAPLVYPLKKAGYVMFVNEEGKLLELKQNLKATRLCVTDVIVGNAVLLRTKGENLVGMEYREAQEMKQFLASLA